MALIQGRHVACPYDVARSTLPRLEYLSADDWLVAVTDFVNITVPCPGVHPREFLVCRPERWNISSNCVLDWPFGRTVPVNRRFFHLRPRYFAPLTWKMMNITPVRREMFRQALEVHAQLFVDPETQLTLQTPPDDVGPWFASDRLAYSAVPLVLVFLAVVVILIIWCRLKCCCFSRLGNPGTGPRVCQDVIAPLPPRQPVALLLSVAAP